MSTQYPGYPSNDSLHSVWNILSSTNATPIVITTSAPHDINDGDIVIVTDHATNTAANGIWKARVLSSTTVALYTSVTSPSVASGPVAGNGVGGGTGQIASLGVNPTYEIPSDDDDIDAAAVNPALEAAGDRWAFVLSKCGVWKPVAVSLRQANGLASGATSAVFGGPGVGCTALDKTWRREGLPGPISLDAFTVAAPNVLDGDLVEAEWRANIDISFDDVVGAGSFFGGIGVEYFESGASPSVAVGSACTIVPGSAQLFVQTKPATGYFTVLPARVRAEFIVSTGVSRFKKMQLYVADRVITGAAVSWALVDDFAWRVKIWRNTGLYA